MEVRIGPREALLLLGVVLLFATVFIVYFFANLPHDSNRNFLIAYFGAPYAFLLVCAVIIAVHLARRRR